MTDLMVFVAFFLLAMVFDWVHGWLEHHPMKKHKHKIAVLAVAGLAHHPSIWHGLHDFVVHFVVYSGAVIPAGVH